MPDQVGYDGWIRPGMTVGSGRARQLDQIGHDGWIRPGMTVGSGRA